MQISFSEYTIVEKAIQALDPLGLMRPANALRDAVFPQFTVLTRHPAHLGLLCAVWQELDATGDAKPGLRARRFRELEVLWGMASAVAGERPVNITKFARLVDAGLPVTLADIPRRDAVFMRLNYGTLGHYSRPALAWGLLRRGNEGLTALGSRLGQGFAHRASSGGLVALFQRWRQGPAFDEAGLLQLADRFGLGAVASPSERAAWGDAIAAHIAAAPERRVLWEQPVDAEVLAHAEETPESWRALWDSLKHRYPTLRPLLDRMDDFERLTAGLQFLFDCQLARAEFSGEAAKFALPVELAPALSALAKHWTATPAGGESVPLVARVADAAPNLAALEQGVLEHHMAHHRQKGARPFLTHEGVQVRGRTDRQRLSAALDKVAAAGTPEAALDELQFRYRRDWHFAKCRLWKDHADGRKELA